MNYASSVALQLRTIDKELITNVTPYFDQVVGLVKNNQLDIVAVDLDFSDYSLTRTSIESDIFSLAEINPNIWFVIYSSYGWDISISPDLKPYNNIVSIKRTEIVSKIIEVVSLVRKDDSNHASVLQSGIINACAGLVLSDILVVSKEWSKILKSNPEHIHRLSPREFEEFVAEIWENKGYKVELTPESRDGGKDMYAYRKNSSGEILLAIECKKYDPSNKVGRPLIQKLNGIVESERLTGGVLATTSYFTKYAIEYAEPLRYRIHLNDLTSLKGILQTEM